MYNVDVRHHCIRTYVTYSLVLSSIRTVQCHDIVPSYIRFTFKLAPGAVRLGTME